MVNQVFSPVLLWKVKVYHRDTPHLYTLITDETLEFLLSDHNLKPGWLYGMAQVDPSSPPTLTVPDFLASYGGYNQ